MSIFPSLLAFAAWDRGVQLIGANRSGPFVHLVPVSTAILGGALPNEHLSAFHVVGSALIIVGVWIAARSSTPRDVAQTYIIAGTTIIPSFQCTDLSGRNGS